ncbi:MAG TPA: alpha/beta family hydrolase [Solirubrobacteraceae bacterium]|nr:alpha/beta family hydrolase [Solirubrobacteraceae bacterium]
MTELEIETPHGPARAHVHGKRGTTGALVLGHGAGGGVGARDLVAATDVALAAGLRVALVEQPYRVAGRRSQAPADQLDAAWIAVVADLRRRRLIAGDLIVGGRSAGARVACRTSAETGATAVLCLAFPLHPPGRPEKSRLPELEAVTVPTLVVQGESDPFGMPPAAPERSVVRVKGNHSLSGDLGAVRAAIEEWLAGLGKPATRTGAPAAR